MKRKARWFWYLAAMMALAPQPADAHRDWHQHAPRFYGPRIHGPRFYYPPPRPYYAPPAGPFYGPPPGMGFGFSAPLGIPLPAFPAPLPPPVRCDHWGCF